jgi:transposase
MSGFPWPAPTPESDEFWRRVARGWRPEHDRQRAPAEPQQAQLKHAASKPPPAAEQRPASRPQPQRGRPADQADIVRRYQAGELISSIAAAHYVSTSTIYRVLDRASITRRDDRHLNRIGKPSPNRGRRKTYPAELVAGVAELYGAGHSLREVADQLDVTHKVVARLMEHHGLPRRPAVRRKERAA